MGILNADSTRRTIHLYRQAGLDALKERVHPGKTSVLTPEIMDDLQQQVNAGQQTWNSRTLVEYVSTTHHIQIARTALRVQLKHAGMSWKRTRLVVAGQADPAQKSSFKVDLESVKKGL